MMVRRQRDRTCGPNRRSKVAHIAAVQVGVRLRHRASILPHHNAAKRVGCVQGSQPVRIMVTHRE